MFFSGQEAVTSVISTALFEELPSYELKEEIVVKDDDTGFGFSNDDINGVRINKVNIAKQFIAFSDSRQAAAFFSSYLDQTYKNILYKRIIVETLKDMHYSSRGKIFNNFVEDIAYQFEEYGIYFRNEDVINKESWKAALRELVDNTGSTSLFSKGLIGISLNSKNIPGNSKLGLTAKQVQNICSIFALWMMADAALDYPANLNKANREYFSHNGIEYSYTLSDSNAKKYIRSFIPTKVNMTNKRLDYFLKVMKKLGYNMDRIEGSRYLQGIWDHIFISNNFKFLTVKNGKYKLNTDKIIISNNNPWYYCPSCKKVTIHNVMNVCPTFKCDGELKLIDLKDKFSRDHYYQLYKTLDIKELRVVEHTAQLDKETAYEYQKKFKNKEIDILSCSTTFEMGVDVGSLETIFMRNMPPSPANYAQRAGRAGRSKKSAAYAITFCNKSNHDFTFFKNPECMIKGRIDPPKFVVENEKIAIRHLYASALSYFWKRYPSYFSRTFNMTESIDGQVSGFEVFKDYLNEHPVDLKRFIDEFLPENLKGKFGIENYSWIDGLMGDEGVFTKAVAEYDYEVGELQDAFNKALKKGRKTDNLNARIRVYKNEDILAFLSRKNVLPKYGFPVDTVEMIINDKSGNSRLGLQLQRDLSMAISEYAPDSQIVANGNLITSRYIRKIPNMSWKQFDYKICDCKTLNIAVHTTDDEDSLDLDKCKQCGASLSEKSKQVFLVPEFGFEADGDKIKKPGLKKPERTYRGEASYVGYRSQVQMQKYRIGNSEFELRLSRGDEMAVLNESNFYVCEYCGYAELHNKIFTRIKRQKHKNPSGYTCRNDGTNRLRKFSLGYRFETDVVQLRFINPDLSDYNISLSVLHGIVLGTCRYLNIEQSDIAGCLEYFYNTVTNRANYSIILYDRTPGGAGHVRRLNNEKVLENILMETLRLMEACNCGGKLGNSSCYSCLRTYYNQRIHDILERRYVINFIKEILM